MDKPTPKKQKYLGGILVILGVALEIFSFIPAGMLVSAVGLGIYVRAKRRNLAWSLLALLLVLGPLFGLLIKESKDLTPPKGMSPLVLKWGVLLYVFYFIVLLVFVPVGFWLRIVSTGDDSGPRLIDTSGGVGLLFGMILALGFSVTFLLALDKSRVSPGWRAAAPWLVSRAVLAGLAIAVWFGSLSTIRDGERKSDLLIEASLSRLKPGMERAMVHNFILETNASLAPKRQTFYLAKLFPPLEWEESRYEEVRNALERAGAGIPVDFRKQKFNTVFFNINERSPSGKDPKHRDIFVRTCCAVMYSREIYDLSIEYDREDHLKLARYLKSHYGDGTTHSYQVRLEIPPSKDKRYPYPCPPDVKDF